MNKQTVTIKTDKENPEPLDIIAKSIIEVAAAFERINASKLKRRAVILLIKDALPSSCKVTTREIEAILDVAPQLKTHYTKS